MAVRYPVPRADVEPRVFVRATDNWNELSARFVVPVRSARRVKDEVTRRVLDRLEAAGIGVASQTADVTVSLADDGVVSRRLGGWTGVSEDEQEKQQC